MPRRTSQHPTEAELEILNILWERGPSTVRDVHEALQADRQTAMTTTLKIMQTMTEKGLTARSDTRPHLYSATAPQEQTQAGLLQSLVERAFGGSVGKLLMRAVQDGRLSGEELREIQKLIESAGKSKRRNRSAK
jgi:predicted transcriptional regulator